MTYQLEIVKRANYLHATVTGVNSRAVLMDYWADILSACQALDCSRVLVEEYLVGPRFDIMEIFSLISDGSMKMLGRFEAIAYVDGEMGEMGEMAGFAETVAVNRGIPVSVFTDIKEAKQWLENLPRASDGNVFRNLHAAPRK